MQGLAGNNKESPRAQKGLGGPGMKWSWVSVLTWISELSFSFMMRAQSTNDDACKRMHVKGSSWNRGVKICLPERKRRERSSWRPALLAWPPACLTEWHSQGIPVDFECDRFLSPTAPQAPIREPRTVRTTGDALVCVASTRGRSTTIITTINTERGEKHGTMSVFIGDSVSLEPYRVTPPRIWKRWIHRVEEKGDGDQGWGNGSRKYVCLDAAHKSKCRRRIQPPLLLLFLFFLPPDVINTWATDSPMPYFNPANACTAVQPPTHLRSSQKRNNSLPNELTIKFYHLISASHTNTTVWIN